VIRADQFTICSLFVAIAFAAAACAKTQLTVKHNEPTAQVIGYFATPILCCGAIGTLKGRLLPWLGFGAAIVAFYAVFAFLCHLGGWV